jgi:hypothetical protein
VGLPGLFSGIGVGLFLLYRRYKGTETGELKKEPEQFNPKIFILLSFTALVILGFVVAIMILTLGKQGGGI